MPGTSASTSVGGSSLSWAADDHVEAGVGSMLPTPLTGCDGNGLVDLVAVLGAESVEVCLDATDELPNPRDLLVRGHGLVLGPGVCFRHRGQPFPVAEQVVNVCLEVGQIGDVGWDACVCVPLCIGVPVGIEDDGGLVEVSAVGPQQRWQTVHPFAMPAAQSAIARRPHQAEAGRHTAAASPPRAGHGRAPHVAVQAEGPAGER